MSDSEAAQAAIERLDGKQLRDPQFIRFTAGKRRKQWCRNVVALGLASGFLEPLESTSIHLVQAGISKLLALFPDNSFEPVLEAEYNRLTAMQLKQVRDFIILHYKASERTGSSFWEEVAAMDIPPSLQSKIELFRESGRIFRHEDELFSHASWLAVLLGQGVVPRRWDPLADAVPVDQIQPILSRMATFIRNAAEQMPAHEQFIATNCGARESGVSADEVRTAV